MKAAISYPDGTKFGMYFMTKENKGTENVFIIRRRVILPDGRVVQPRYPTTKYTHLKTEEEIKKFVERLNGRENRRAIKEIQTKLAFLPTVLMEEFRETLQAEIPNEKDSKLLYQNLHRYCLSFFVDKMGLKDPIEWKSNETKWGLALLNELATSDSKLRIFPKENKKAAKTIRGIIQVANRFLAFLHKKMPQEIPFIKLEPISKAKFKHYKAELELQKSADIGRFIPDQDWEIIKNNLTDSLAPFVLMAYYYGLRRSETLGLELADIRKGYLSVERQLQSVSRSDKVFKPLKNRNKRQTPHWFLGPDEAFIIIKDMENRIMHPDTLGRAFAALMLSLNLPYEMHDLRRTFITKALRKHNAVDVQHAVGHGDIRTTMSYQQDDREMDNDVFVPAPLHVVKK